MAGTLDGLCGSRLGPTQSRRYLGASHPPAMGMVLRCEGQSAHPLGKRYRDNCIQHPWGWASHMVPADIPALTHTWSNTLTLPPGNGAGTARRSDPSPGNWAPSCCTPAGHQFLLDSPQLDGRRMDVRTHCRGQHQCRLDKGRAGKGDVPRSNQRFI
jgi:hypothetical protein